MCRDRMPQLDVFELVIVCCIGVISLMYIIILNQSVPTVRYIFEYDRMNCTT